jgi:hypothetical protein
MQQRARRAVSRRAFWSLAFAAGLVLPSLSCDSLLVPLPADARRFAPPPIYKIWWEQIVSCANISRDMRELDFLVVRGRPTVDAEGEAAGRFYSYRSAIVLGEAYQYDGSVVRHEMLHALMPTNGGHPREYFLHRCGDVVGCGNGYPCPGMENPLFALPATIVNLPAESLTVTASVKPGAPVQSVTGDWLSLEILATNPRPYPVLVRFAEDTFPGGARPFGFRVEYGATGHGGASWYDGFMYDEGMRYFRAGETKRAVFDFGIVGSGDPYPVPLGPSRYFGRFGGIATPPITITIAP